MQYNTLFACIKNDGLGLTNGLPPPFTRRFRCRVRTRFVILHFSLTDRGECLSLLCATWDIHFCTKSASSLGTSLLNNWDSVTGYAGL